MGLGHFGGGVGVARWLAAQGARVTVTDLAGAEQLADSLEQLNGVPIEAFRLGGHCEDDFRRADTVVVNPAVRPSSAYVEAARTAGATITTELGLMLAHCPARMIGVTGSNGKSTTASMIHAMLAADGRSAWLGGNLGGSLLADLDRIQPEDWVVLEISSFQLAWMPRGIPMPHVAVVTGCTPNHLDWHRDMRDYIATKQRLIVEQRQGDVAVLNTHDAEVARWQSLARGRVVEPVSIEALDELPLPGAHNRINASCAAAACRTIGCKEAAIRSGLASLGPLPSRLEPIATHCGVTFYDDSAATTPESTIAALRAIDRPVWLLAGGKNKGADFSQMATSIIQHARGAAFFGAARDELQRCCRAIDGSFAHGSVERLDDALRWCVDRAVDGDVVLLSPGCSSQDQYRNYRARGEHYRALVDAFVNRYDR